MACIVETSRLNEAALAIHKLLDSRKFEHAFFGGFQLAHLGSTRGTRNVEVLVKTPMFNGFDKVKQAFLEGSTEFSVFSGRGTDGMAIIHRPTTVHVALVLQERLPRSLITNLAGTVPDADSADPGLHHLPFLSSTHLFIRIVQSMGTRAMDSDRKDLLFLKEMFASQLDMSKVNKKVTEVERREAMRNLRRSGNSDEYDRALGLLKGLAPVNS